jgi:hypothetical protein
VAPGARVIVPWSNVVGYAADRHDYVVLWWVAVSDGHGGLNPAAGGSVPFRR